MGGTTSTARFVPIEGRACFFMEKIFKKALLIDEKNGQRRGRVFREIKSIETVAGGSIIVADNHRIDLGLKPQILQLRRYRYSPGTIIEMPEQASDHGFCPAEQERFKECYTEYGLERQFSLN